MKATYKTLPQAITLPRRSFVALAAAGLANALIVNPARSADASSSYYRSINFTVNRDVALELIDYAIDKQGFNGTYQLLWNNCYDKVSEILETQRIEIEYDWTGTVEFIAQTVAAIAVVSPTFAATMTTSVAAGTAIEGHLKTEEADVLVRAESICLLNDWLLVERYDGSDWLSPIPSDGFCYVQITTLGNCEDLSVFKDDLSRFFGSYSTRNTYVCALVKRGTGGVNSLGAFKLNGEQSAVDANDSCTWKNSSWDSSALKQRLMSSKKNPQHNLQS